MKRDTTRPPSSFFWRTTVDGKKHLKIRPLRWCVPILLASFFLLSYGFDVQMLEGSLVASRLMGYHLVDLYCSLEVIAAHHKIATNLMIGMISIALIYWMIGGRSFCAWVCPYGLLSEWAQSMHRWLVKRGVIKKRKKVTTQIKYVFLVSFLLASALSGYLIFEHINVVGIISRWLIYGLTESALVVVVVLTFEIFFYERVWCRSICPSGTVYGLLNPIALIRIEADRTLCDNCGDCTPACHVPEALAPVFISKDGTVFLNSTDCTMCGKCLDACSRDVFHFNHRLKDLV